MDKISPQNHRLVLLYVLAYPVAHQGMSEWAELIVFSLSFYAIVTGNTKKAWFWLSLSSIFIFHLFTHYHKSANHTYLTTYLIVAITIYHIYTKNDSIDSSDRIPNLPRILMLLVFVTATFHKSSDYFISGRLLADYTLRGSGNFINQMMNQMYPNFSEYVSAYENNLDLIKQNTFYGINSVPVYTPPGFELIFRYMSVSVFVFELLLSVGIAIKRVFLHKVFQFAFICFVWGTFLIRKEFFFFSLLSILYLLSSNKLGKRFTLILYGTIALFIAAELN